MNASRNRYRKLIPLILAGGVLGASTGLWATPKAPKESAPPATSLNLQMDATPIARQGGIAASYSDVVKRVGPSVVQVNVVQKARLARGDLSGIPPEFRRFFGPGSPFGSLEAPGTPRQQGVGSGVIVTKDGYILTNNHVIDGADEVKVTLQDGREFTAKVVGKDPKTDVAVLKVDAGELPAASLADSDQIEVGDVVLALGNPFGIGQTVTMGIVSATGRASMGLDYEDFIQTDAAINPGNSGGALVDAQGRLIGINTAILSRTGGNHGIGFAIPVSMAKDVLEALVTDGRVTRGYLGVLIQDINPALARQFGLSEARGALIGDVTPRSPAERAGLKSGDVVVSLDGREVRDSRTLKLAVAKVRPGQTAELKVLRNGKEREVQVKVAELPGDPSIAQATPEPDSGSLKGVGVATLDARLRRQFNVPPGVEGAVVTEVVPGSAAAEAGLQVGDVLLEINREPVANADDAIALTAKPGDRATLVRVWSRGTSRYVVVEEPESQG